VLAPPYWRPRIARLLFNYGLLIDQAIAHLPDHASSRYLVPLSHIPAQYASSTLLPLPQWGRLAAKVGLRLPRCDRMLRHLLPSTALVMRRPNARPIFNWLFQMQPANRQPGTVIIGTSWRGKQGAVILYRFSGQDHRPSAIAKMNLMEGSTGNRMREATALKRLGPGARSAGAQIPQLLSVGRINQYPVLLQSPISGQSFAKLLSYHPKRLPEVFECVSSWLERWNRETMVVRPMHRELLERDILAPAATLASLLKKRSEYRDWLQMRSVRLVGAPAPLVATHNDLTMWNIFRENKVDIGIIDWETARDTGLPLVDLFYAVVDGVAATQGYADRLRAFTACFVTGGIHEPVIEHLVRRLQRAIRLPDELLELCFHSCWIHHAANEHHSTGQSEGPFIKIAQWLAMNPGQISPWIRG